MDDLAKFCRPLFRGDFQALLLRQRAAPNCANKCGEDLWASHRCTSQ